MQRNNLQRKTKLVTSAQVGRGGTRGKTSGRGTKGQNARAGHKNRPEMRDIIKKLPKLRGRGKNSNKPVSEKYVVVLISKIEREFSKGDIVSPQSIVEKGLAKKRLGKFPRVKILSDISPKNSYKFDKVKLSSGLKKELEKLGSTF